MTLSSPHRHTGADCGGGAEGVSEGSSPTGRPTSVALVPLSPRRLGACEVTPRGPKTVAAPSPSLPRLHNSTITPLTSSPSGDASAVVCDSGRTHAAVAGYRAGDEGPTALDGALEAEFRDALWQPRHVPFDPRVLMRTLPAGLGAAGRFGGVGASERPVLRLDQIVDGRAPVDATGAPMRTAFELSRIARQAPVRSTAAVSERRRCVPSVLISTRRIIPPRPPGTMAPRRAEQIARHDGMSAVARWRLANGLDPVTEVIAAYRVEGAGNRGETTANAL